MRRTRRVLIAILLILVIVLATACGGVSDSTSSGDASNDGTSAGAVSQGLPQSPETGASGATASGPTAPGETSAAGSVTDQGTHVAVLAQQGQARSIVYVSTMVLVVDDVPTAANQAKTAMAGLGGLVFGENTVTDPVQRTVLTFRVPPSAFDQAQQQLAKIGKLESQQTDATDVTERVVDMQSRILTAEASVVRLRTFLEGATSTDSVTQLERELLQRETDLELLRGQLRTLQDQVALATITLTLTEKTPPIPEAAAKVLQTGYVGHDAGDRCPSDNELEIVEHEPMTICISVENTGNLVLSQIEIRDAGLDLKHDKFVALIGDPAGNLQPGERLVGYFEMQAPLGATPSPTLTATVLNADGDKVRTGIAVEREVLDLRVAKDLSIPGFSSGLSASFRALTKLAQVTVLMIGVAVPFLWVPLLVVLVVWWVRRRRALAHHASMPSAMNDQEDEANSAD